MQSPDRLQVLNIVRDIVRARHLSRVKLSENSSKYVKCLSLNLIGPPTGKKA